MLYEVMYHIEADSPEEAAASAPSDLNIVVFVEELPTDGTIKPTTFRRHPDSGELLPQCEEAA